MTRTEAEQILRAFTCVEQTGVQPTQDDQVIRDAIAIVAELSDYQILGICADDAESAVQAMKDYMTALGYERVPEVNSVAGTVYLKFNPKSGRSQMEPYVGKHRGVLVSCQSAYDDGVNETFGHLPLGLFR
jgi:Domain of unknown function (DUF1824)